MSEARTLLTYILAIATFTLVAIPVLGMIAPYHRDTLYMIPVSPAVVVSGYDFNGTNVSIHLKVYDKITITGITAATEYMYYNYITYSNGMTPIGDAVGAVGRSTRVNIVLRPGRHAITVHYPYALVADIKRGHDGYYIEETYGSAASFGLKTTIRYRVDLAKFKPMNLTLSVTRGATYVIIRPRVDNGDVFYIVYGAPRGGWKLIHAGFHMIYARSGMHIVKVPAGTYSMIRFGNFSAAVRFVKQLYAGGCTDAVYYTAGMFPKHPPRNVTNYNGTCVAVVSDYAGVCDSACVRRVLDVKAQQVSVIDRIVGVRSLGNGWKAYLVKHITVIRYYGDENRVAKASEYKIIFTPLSPEKLREMLRSRAPAPFGWVAYKIIYIRLSDHKEFSVFAVVNPPFDPSTLG